MLNQSDFLIGKISKMLDKRARAQTKVVVFNEASSSFTSPVRIYRQVFTASTTIIVAHNLGKLPIFQLAFDNGDGTYDSEKHILYNVLHDSINQLTITLSVAGSGVVICMG